MWAVRVVMLDVDGEHALEMAPAEDQQSVEAFEASWSVLRGVAR